MKKSISILIVVIACVIVIGVVFGYYYSNQPNVSSSHDSIQPVASYYLTLPTGYLQSLDNQSQGNESRIFVVSANASYSNYPFPTVRYGPYQNPAGAIIAKQGEPCVIINITLRNDYSSQNPAPYSDYLNNSDSAYIGLTAKIFSGTNQINATDITNASPIAGAGSNEAFAGVKYGTMDSVTIYLATDNTNITSFQLVANYIGVIPPP